MATIEFESASRVYPGEPRPALNSLDLTINDGEFLVLVGPSGCGKTTSLRMLAGLEPVTSGRTLIDGVDVTNRPPKGRDIAMVFQSYALYPHMSVGENMSFSLRIAKLPAAEIDRRVTEAARLLDLEALLDRRPKMLSGGQRQRVAMGRAIVREPRVFLMDEPLSNLDAKLRVQTRIQIAALQRRLRTTTLYVTHDQTEAMTLGDRVAVLREGVLQQVGSPEALYHRPINAFVAGFIGSPPMNLLGATLSSDGARIGTAVVPVSRETLTQCLRRGVESVTFGFRPECVVVPAQRSRLSLRVELVERLGVDTYLYGELAEASDAGQVAVRTTGDHRYSVGQVVPFDVDPSDVRLFDSHSGSALS